MEAIRARDRSLDEWFNRIRTGQLRLPRFQRGEEWDHDLVGGLLESVLRGLPAGSALVLEVGGEEKFKSRPMEGAPLPTERVTEHLLDGQQRLTALWRSLHDNYENRTFFVCFELDDEDNNKQVARILDHARWHGKKVWADIPKDTYARGYIPMKLLRPGDIGTEVRDWCDLATDGNQVASLKLEIAIRELREAVKFYNIPFLSLPASTPKDVALDVFIKLNTNAIALTAFDIVVAQVEGETGESLQELVDGLKRGVATIEAYFKEPSKPPNLVLDVASLREDQPPTQASYLRLVPSRLINDWNGITQGIKFALGLLEEEHIFDSERLPTIAVVPVLAALHRFVPSAPDALGNAKVLLRKYIWRAFLTERYANAAATKALQDMRGLRAILQGDVASDVPIFNESEFPFPTSVEFLIRQQWPKRRDIIARGILAVSIKAGANDIADGTPANRESLKDREYHHLFPDSLLTGDGGLSQIDSSQVLNCVLLTWRTNRTISAKDPVSYLLERTKASNLGEAEIRARLNSHIVPYDALAVGGYEQITDLSARQDKIQADYYQFLSKRAELLLDPIRILCEGQMWPR